MLRSNATVVLDGALCCVCSSSRGMVDMRPPFVSRTALQWCKPAVTDHMTAFTARWGSTVRRRPALKASAHKHAHPSVTLLPNALRPRWVTAGSRLLRAKYRHFVSALIRTVKVFSEWMFFCCSVSLPPGDQFFLVQLPEIAAWLPALLWLREKQRLIVSLCFPAQYLKTGEYI